MLCQDDYNNYNNQYKKAIFLILDAEHRYTTTPLDKPPKYYMLGMVEICWFQRDQSLTEVFLDFLVFLCITPEGNAANWCAPRKSVE